MKAQLVFILITLLYVSCDENEISMPPNAKIKIKYVTLDEHLSPSHINCSTGSVPYLTMNQSDCSFELGNHEFDIEKAYLLDSTGNLRKFLKYGSEGPLTYTILDLDADPKYKKYEGLENFQVKIAENRKAIIDGNNSFLIEQIFEKERLIIVETSKNSKFEGRRVFYGY